MISLFNKVIIAECNQGQKKEGVENGGYFICDKLNIAPNAVVYNSLLNDIDSTIENGYEQLSFLLQTYHHNDYITLLIGGDHSLGISSVDAFLDIYKEDLSVLWIDAHADINDHLTSITGNLHGMPLGYHHILRSDKPIWRNNQYRLKSSQLYYYGIRDLDIEEKKLIDQDKIGYSLDLDYNLKNFINNSKKLLISFDVDALDPRYMDSTGCIAENGLTPSSVKYIIKYATDAKKLIHLDLMEFNPKLGDPEKSIEAIKEILL